MKFHIVKNGESINTILNIYSLQKDELVESNRHIRSWDRLIPGSKLKIPTITSVIDQDVIDMEPFIEDYYPKNIYNENKTYNKQQNNTEIDKSKEKNIEANKDLYNMQEPSDKKYIDSIDTSLEENKENQNYSDKENEVKDLESNENLEYQNKSIQETNISTSTNTIKNEEKELSIPYPHKKQNNIRKLNYYPYYYYNPYYGQYFVYYYPALSKYPGNQIPKVKKSKNKYQK